MDYEKWLKKKASGIITPAITPFKGGKFDSKAIAALIDFLEKNGASGIFPAGSNGCGALLSLEQHVLLIKEFSEFTGSNLFMLPGVGRNSVEETLEVAHSAMKNGADALVIVTPYYLKMDEKSLFKYFDSVADKIDASIILYNIPQFTGNWITLGMVKKLAGRHKNIIGVKDSSGDFRSISGFIEGMGGKFAVFQGQDDLLLPSLMIGAHGGVCGTTNFTKLAFDVYKAYVSGRLDMAKELQERLTELMHLFTYAQFPSDYNYMFYRRIMHSKETNAVPPLESISAKYGEDLYKSASRLID